MPCDVRLLSPGDEPVLAKLARQESDFDLAGRGRPREPLPAELRDFLADPHSLCWIAESGGAVVGFLSCQLLRRRAEAPELLLYEIGVRAAARRRGVGRALIRAMDDWMREHAVEEVWLLADNPEAVEFYRDSGFAVADGQATYMTRHRTAG